MDAALIATLGAEPQVIPLATELLVRQGVSLHAVYVLHTDPDGPPAGTGEAQTLRKQK